MTMKDNDMHKVSEFMVKQAEFGEAFAEFGKLIWPAVLLAGNMAHYDKEDITDVSWAHDNGEIFLCVELSWASHTSDSVMIPENWLEGDIWDNVESIKKSRAAKRNKEIKASAIADLRRRAAELGMTVSEISK